MADAVGILERLLGFITAPWKAFALAGLLIVAGTGWVIWDKRDELFEAWLTPTSAALRTGAVPAALEKLVGEVDADIIQIWAVDLSSNSQWFLGARRHDGDRPVIPSPRRLPVIVYASDIRGLVAVMNGSPSCVDLTAAGSPIAQRLADRGMHRGCAVPIPPTADAFVGVIYLAWAKATDPQAEGVAIHAAREVARTLATH